MAPVKGSITTPTTDLTTFMGPVTDRAGKRVGNLQGYCVTIEDRTGSAECTTTIFLFGSQITLTGPTYNRRVHSHFDQAVAGGTGRYQNARGQAAVTLLKNKNVEYDVNLIPWPTPRCGKAFAIPQRRGNPARRANPSAAGKPPRL